MKGFVILYLLVLLFTVTFNNTNAQVSLFPPPPDDVCGGSIPQRLGIAIEELNSHIPVIEIASLLLETLSERGELTDFLEFLGERPFSRILYDVGELDEYKSLIDYFCDELYYNIAYYVYLICDLFELQPMPPSTAEEQQSSKLRSFINNVEHININPITRERRPGLLGFFLDVNDLIPLDILQSIFFDMMDTNEYVIMAMDKLKNPEFKKIADYIQGMPEFYEVLIVMRQYQLPIDCTIYQLNTFLGWKLYPWLHIDDDCQLIELK